MAFNGKLIADTSLGGEYIYMLVPPFVLIVFFHHCSVQSSLAGALTVLKRLPEKMNPIVRPLMDTIKKEQNSQLQVSHCSSVCKCMNDFVLCQDTHKIY